MREREDGEALGWRLTRGWGWDIGEVGNLGEGQEFLRVSGLDRVR